MMSWALNYQMPVNGIVWTAFFAGATLTPQWRIDGPQLCRNYLHASTTSARCGPWPDGLRELPNVLGFDSLNEPGQGWIGARRLSGSPQEENPFAPPRCCAGRRRGRRWMGSRWRAA